MYDRPIISDVEFDMLERDYESLAEELGEPATASNMVGFDPERYSCRTVLNKPGMLRVSTHLERKKK